MEDERTETVKILIRSMCFEFVYGGIGRVRNGAIP